MPPQTICTTDVTESLPSSPSGHRLIGLAWSIPVLLAFYLGLGYWLGGLCGSPGLGLFAGWLAGMGAVFYEIRKHLRDDRRSGGADSSA